MRRPAAIISFLVVGLTVFGVLMVGNASVVDAVRDFGDKWYYFRLQAMWAILGLGGFFLASWWPYRSWEKFGQSLFIVSVILLAAVLLPGVGTKLLGARRWISLGGVNFQPAELAKLSLGVFLARLFSQDTARFRVFVVWVGLFVGLVLLEPDMGTAMVILGIGIVSYFGAGGQLKKLAWLLPVAGAGMLLLIVASPYRFNRLQTYLDISKDPLGTSYHIRQVLLGLGSGGTFGVGLGQSRQKYEYLPEATTDSIFAVIGEELGLVGTTAILVAFLWLGLTGLKIAGQASDKFGANLAINITGWITLQVLVNTAAMVALIPLTGVPLPFVSYGGSALVITLIGCGILVSIAKDGKHK